MDITSNNIVNAVDELVAKGYSHDFRLGDGQLLNVTTGMSIPPDDFQVDAAYRFEAAPGSDDCSNLYAISSASGDVKGLLIDAFDLFEQETNARVFERLNVSPAVSAYDNSEDAPMKYGIPKIFKADFNEDSDRYVLRKGFPDFPECPFGQSFTMLGYDKRDERYVWLVTSIFKDDRLGVETFLDTV
jgi:hypothetical protein